jgi:hypothetical protein
MRKLVLATALAGVWLGNAQAQRPGTEVGTGNSLPRSDAASNIDAATTRSELAPTLPVPAVPDDIRALLVAARQALAAGRTGEAQEALERAETRALDRSIVVGTENVPARGPVISGIGRARHALSAGDIRSALVEINAVLPATR